MSEVRPAAEERSAPRTWPTWVTMFLILPVGTLTVSMVSILAGALLSEGVNPTEPGAMEAWLTEVVASPAGILILIAPSQLFFLALSLGAALPSPEPLKERLGLVRPALSPTAVAFLCLGTPAIQLLSVLLGSLFFDMSEPSEHLKMLGGLFTGQEGVLGVGLLILFVGLMPGLSEELFFRGYVRVGLGRRFGLFITIFLPAVIFAAIHGDLMHATVVLPLGLWFGGLALWSRSVIPAIIAHAINNLFSVLNARSQGAAGEEPASEAVTELSTLAQSGYALSLVLLLCGLFLTKRELGRAREARSL